MSSFAELKRNSKAQFKQLAEKMNQENLKEFSDTRFWDPEVDKSRKWVFNH